MSSVIRDFLKKPATIVGIVTAILFQVIFSCIWMTAYKGVTDRTGELSVGIFNEDRQLGQTVADSLSGNLPFRLVSIGSQEEGTKLLNERKLQLVLHIPADFTRKASSLTEQAKLEFTVNESNPALIKSMMTSAASGISEAVNKQASSAGAKALLEGLKAPAATVSAASQGLGERVVSEVHSLNAVNGMNNQMVPLMLVLASYVGAMIMGMNFEQSSMMMKQAGIGRWKRFAARVILNSAASVIVSLVGTLLLISLGGQHEHGFIVQWAFQALFVLTFMLVAQMFLFVLGMAGMLFNALMLSAQLVTSGAMVPRELLSDFYAGLGNVLPATYAVEGEMNLLFGGAGTSNDVFVLALIALIALGVSTAAVALRREAVKPNAAAVSFSSN
ncbi:YhgE/Pip domain-containing protein [Paenibacillus beijingensis]|uniref:ABC transporter n=1 Tax=Paenibacillus beijingensis TaxID=1126833 RepID=A0A0D5NF45_9BACL|nr:ABC transporter permease [Paenibacillus beijingensis]AJY73861.1 ABC transporter [Paenibacillus beijingensis]